MLVTLVLIVLLGLAGLMQGALALARNARAAYIGGSSGRHAALLIVSLAAGAALAVGTLYVSYPFGVGRIHGFPFPTATPSEWALTSELRGTLPEVDGSVARLGPVEYPMQLANMAFAFVLPQLPLRWLLRKRALEVKPGGHPLRSRKWVDLLLLVVTGVALVSYVPIMTWIPRASVRLPSLFDRMVLIGPPLVVLVAWCVASAWIFDSGLTHRARWVWAVLLMFGIMGFPASCLYSFFYSRRQPVIFTSQFDGHWRAGSSPPYVSEALAPRCSKMTPPSRATLSPTTRVPAGDLKVASLSRQRPRTSARVGVTSDRSAHRPALRSIRA